MRIKSRTITRPFIANISPTDCPATEAFGTTSATQNLFEWQTDALDAANPSNAQVDGADMVANSFVATNRVGNRTQISTKGIIVTGRSEAVNKAGRASEMAYQVRKQTLALKRDVEAVIVQNNASSAGSSSTASTTAGLESWYVTNTSRGTGGANGGYSAGVVNAPTDGTQRAFTEALLKTVLQNVWNSGGNASILMMDGAQKQTFSTFTGRSTSFEQADALTAHGAIDFYISDFGTLKAVPNRFQRHRTVHVLQPDMFKIAYLRPYQIKDIAPTGDSIKKEILVEYGLMSLNEAASGCVADLS